MGENRSGASAGPNIKKEMELAWTYTLRRNDDSITEQALVDTTRPQRKRTTKKYLEKRSGERNVDSRIGLQAEYKQ